MKKGDLLELEVEGFAFEGKGIARVSKDPVDGKGETSKYVIFVHGAYPGDIVEAQLVKIKKSYAEAKSVKVISPSQFRVKARCKYFGVCGGCKQQDLDYKAQANFKQQQVEQIFSKMGGYDKLNVEEIIPSTNIFFYRNKMEFSLAEKRWLTLDEINTGKEIDRNFALGLHIPNLFDKVLDIDECFLQSEFSNKILNFTRDFFKSKSVSIYSSKTNSGYLRNLVIKQSHNTKDLMVNLVTFYEDERLMDEYTGMILKAIPQITTIVNNINLKKALIATGDYEKVFYGNGFIFDLIGKYKFRISAYSFFQTNTIQAEKLFQSTMDFAGLTGREIVYDL
ncbi:MAG: class I SAM-dependent RNA methyltransferase, partial [Ignavibacteriaceae bacterium]